MPRISKGLKQAYDNQDFAQRAIEGLERSLTDETGALRVTREDSQAIAALIKSWQMCQEQIRIHRNKPMPGSLRPVAKQPKTRKRGVPAGPIIDSGSPTV